MGKRISGLQTRCRIALLRACGRRVTAGRGTVIARRARLAIAGAPIALGRNCFVSEFSILSSHGGPITLGNSVGIGPFCMIHGNCEIGDNVQFASHVVVVPSDHAYRDRTRLIRKQGETKGHIRIGNDVWIGAGAKLLRGSDIGEGCVVGAGAVVKGRLEPYGVYVGVPARKIGERA